MGQHLVELIGTEALSVVGGIDEGFRSQVEADWAESEIKADSSLQETEKSQLIRSRRGQGVFRSRLERIEPKCRITGVRERQHLVASHIKPWAASSHEERLDENNGLLLAPHVDHLFDKGYISFTDNGELLISPELSPDTLIAWGIQSSAVGEFSEKQRTYLAYHRAQVFRSGDD
jgi:predicted restriction endonuclease